MRLAISSVAENLSKTPSVSPVVGVDDTLKALAGI
jgi:hypothetical protein